MPFADVSVEELLLRRYKPVGDRLRPEDDMAGHTGYMLHARLISREVDPMQWLSRDRKRYRARMAAKERAAREAVEREQSGQKYPKMPLP